MFPIQLMLLHRGFNAKIAKKVTFWLVTTNPYFDSGLMFGTSVEGHARTFNPSCQPNVIDVDFSASFSGF